MCVVYIYILFIKRLFIKLKRSFYDDKHLLGITTMTQTGSFTALRGAISSYLCVTFLSGSVPASFSLLNTYGISDFGVFALGALLNSYC